MIIPALSSTGTGNITSIDDEIYEGDETTSLYINFIEGADAQQGSPSRQSFTITEDDPCLLYTSPSPRGATLSRMPSSA